MNEPIPLSEPPELHEPQRVLSELNIKVFALQDAMYGLARCDKGSAEEAAEISKIQALRTELYAETYNGTVGIAMTILGTQYNSDIQDVVQDSYAKAFSRVLSFKGKSEFSTWFYRVVANTAFDHVSSEGKRRKREISIHAPLYDGDNGEPNTIYDSLGFADPSYENIDHIQEIEKMYDYVMHYVNQLPNKLRVVVLARYAAELTVAEVMEKYNIGESAAKQRAKRGLHALRVALGISEADH